ncbi:MAG: flagellar basal body P-ring formation chaperone FlgA [Myxococcota bacterium]
MRRSRFAGARRRAAAVAALLVSMLCLQALAASAAHADAGQKQVRKDIERFVRARIASTEAYGSRTSIDVPPLGSFTVDRDRYAGPLRTEISTRAPEPLRGRVPLAIALYAGDHLVRRAVVTPYVRRTERVLVPVRDLRTGTILGEGDFTTVDRDANRLPRDVVRDTAEVIGLRAKRSLRKDRVFRASQVEGVPLVERGDRVQIVLQAGALRISAAGKAQEAGALGDWIRVMNMDSKRELSGRVDAEGRVHVAF